MTMETPHCGLHDQFKTYILCLSLAVIIKSECSEEYFGRRCELPTHLWSPNIKVSYFRLAEGQPMRCEYRIRWKQRVIMGSNMSSLVALHVHYDDVIMSGMASQITSVSIVCSTVGSGEDQRKHQSSASLAFVRGIHWWPVNSPHKGPVTRKLSPFDDVIMLSLCSTWVPMTTKSLLWQCP